MFLLPSLFAVASLAPELAVAQAVNQIDGTGLIDYGAKPSFKIGTWAKYHVKGSDESGATDEYTITVLIAGEETFWGDDCFWVETLKEDERGPTTVATLVSYTIFDDPRPIPNLQMYLRKFLDNLDESGNPVEQVPRPPRTVAQRRTSKSATPRWSVDTLGTEEITVPKGTFLCRKVAMREVTTATADRGDSSIHREMAEGRIAYMSDRVPLTRLVREDLEYRSSAKSWKLGQSQGPGSRYENVAKGSAVLIDYGEGMTPQLVPAGRRIRKSETTGTGTKSGAKGKSSG
jgi:hypothetical protein